MKHRPLARLRADSPHLLLLPNERRRLARADSGSGRRFARSIPVLRPLVHAGFRGAIEHALVMSIRGLRSEDVDISSPAPGAVRVTFLRPTTEREMRAAKNVLLDVVPGWCDFELVGPPSA